MNTFTEPIVIGSPTDNAICNYYPLATQATPGQIEQAAVWYHEAQEVAEDIAELLGKSLEVGASVVSAFSPRERWSSNVAKAFAFASGKPVSGLPNNLKMANSALELGFDLQEIQGHIYYFCVFCSRKRRIKQMAPGYIKIVAELIPITQIIPWLPRFYRWIVHVA